MKRLIDITITILFLPILLIIYPLLVVLISFSDGRPAIYKQERVGQKGKLFLLYKFRTMDILSNDAVHEEHYKNLSKQKNC